MNIEFRFLQKAIEDKNYVKFFYKSQNIKKVKPLGLIKRGELYFLHTPKKIFEFKNITKLQILKERF